VNVLGVKCVGHDTGAALLSNGKVVALSEERLTRKKHSPGIFPEQSIEYCLNFLNCAPADIDLIVVAEERHQVGDFDVKDIFLRRMGARFANARVESVNHHNAHAASAFFVSPFDEAAILIYDGFGEELKSHLGAVLETETLYVGRANSFAEIHKTVHHVKNGRTPYSNGIGMVYAKVCQKYLKLGRFNEGKMMGLAPYGNDSFLKQYPFEKWVRDDGRDIVLNPLISFAPSKLGGFSGAIKNPKKAMLLFWYGLGRLSKKITQKATSRFRLKTQEELFEEIHLNIPARSGQALPDDYYTSVAYAVQKILEEVCLRFAKKLFAITRSENICIAGGVGLNIDANRRILDESGFKHIFIQPAASDAGIPLGAALYGFHMILKQPRFFNMQSASLGRPYGDTEIRNAVETFKEKINFRKSTEASKEAAKAISENNIIGWFQGGSEYGPRALGNRSILCDARNPEMLTIVNKRVKQRELWRPFAASVLLERVNDFF